MTRLRNARHILGFAMLTRLAATAGDVTVVQHHGLVADAEGRLRILADFEVGRASAPAPS